LSAEAAGETEASLGILRLIQTERVNKVKVFKRNTQLKKKQNNNTDNGKEKRRRGFWCTGS
jgi:hypothetical protein